MMGAKCSHAAIQLATQGLLNPDVHMFVQEDFCQVEPDIVTTVMTQLSLKAGLKTWGDQDAAQPAPR